MSMTPRWKSEQDALNRVCPVDSSLTGSDVTTGLGVNHTWIPAHNGNTLSFCKGASLLTGGTPGFLAVHLCNDPAGVWYLMDLRPGAGIFGCEFDLIGDATVGTTVTLDTLLYIYPGLYKTASNTL